MAGNSSILRAILGSESQSESSRLYVFFAAVGLSAWEVFQPVDVPGPLRGFFCEVSGWYSKP